MNAILGLWRRELRAHRWALLILALMGLSLDVLQLAQSARIGDVTPFHRPMEMLVYFTAIVAAVLANRVFVGETEQRTWPWLFSLPMSRTAVMLAKLAFVVIGTIVFIDVRLGAHAILGTPAAWPELTVRVFTRATAVAALLATFMSAASLLGRRAAMPGLIALAGLNVLGDLAGIEILEEGPLGLVNAAHAGIDDLSWPVIDLITTAALSLVAAGVLVGVSRAPHVTAWMAQPWSRRASVVLAAMLGLVFTVEVSARRRPVDAMPVGLEVSPLHPVVLPTPRPREGDNAPGLEASRAAIEAAVALMAGAVPGATFPRTILVRREDLEQPFASFIDDDTLLVAAASTVTAERAAAVAVSSILWRLDRADDGVTGLVRAGLATVIVERVVAPEQLQVFVMHRRADCDDARRWPALRRSFASGTAAAGLLHDVVAHRGEGALAAILAAYWNAPEDLDELVCGAPVPPAPAPWITVEAPVPASVELRQISALTMAPFVKIDAPPETLRAVVVVRQDHVIDIGRPSTLVEEPVPVERLRQGTLLSVAVAPKTRVSIEVILTTERDGRRGMVSTGRLRPEAP